MWFFKNSHNTITVESFFLRKKRTEDGNHCFPEVSALRGAVDPIWSWALVKNTGLVNRWGLWELGQHQREGVSVPGAVHSVTICSVLEVLHTSSWMISVTSPSLASPGRLLNLSHIILLRNATSYNNNNNNNNPNGYHFRDVHSMPGTMLGTSHTLSHLKPLTTLRDSYFNFIWVRCGNWGGLG